MRLTYYPHQSDWIDTIFWLNRCSTRNWKLQKHWKTSDLCLRISLFLTIVLLYWFDFGHPTLKPGIFGHRTINAMHNWPWHGFDGRFSVMWTPSRHVAVGPTSQLILSLLSCPAGSDGNGDRAACGRRSNEGWALWRRGLTGGWSGGSREAGRSPVEARRWAAAPVRLSALPMPRWSALARMGRHAGELGMWLGDV